jgi:hypothetical protein
MQELLFGPYLGPWGLQILAFGKQHPWRVFAAVLVAILLMQLMFGKRSPGSGGDGEFGGFDFGGCDGDSGGD